MREFRGKCRELGTSAPGFVAGKGRQWPWGSVTLGAWVHGRNLKEHGMVATHAPDVSLRFSSCWCHSVQLPEGKSNVTIRTEWKENSGTGRKGEVGKPIYEYSAGNYGVQGGKKEVGMMGSE